MQFAISVAIAIGVMLAAWLTVDLLLHVIRL
jgi:hypothetical protein